jgi:hypothetical protein
MGDVGYAAQSLKCIGYESSIGCEGLTMVRTVKNKSL